MQQKETFTIKATKGWMGVFDFDELWRYKDLLYFLTIRGIKAKYAQSVLGISWAIIQPLVTTLVFTVVFGSFAKVDSMGIPYPLFSYMGMLCWTYFANTLTDSSNSLIQNADMITKVYFPRAVLPLSAAFSKFVDFVIGFVVLVGMLIYYRQVPDWTILMLPVLLIILLLTSLGLGMLFSAMSVQYRDIKHGLSFFVQLLMYSAPVVYSTFAISPEYRYLYALNPMVGVIEGFRAAFTGSEFPWLFLAEAAAMSTLLFLLGAIYFRKMERSFADVA